jgi:hypothetical protein
MESFGIVKLDVPTGAAPDDMSVVHSQNHNWQRKKDILGASLPQRHGLHSKSHTA